MPLLKHRGGSLTAVDDKGNKVVFHYGPGLHQSCPDCKQPADQLCITNSGKLLGKIHKSRG